MKFDVASDLHVDAWENEAHEYDEDGRLPRTWKTGYEGLPEAFLHIDWEFYKNPDSQGLIIAGDTANSVDYLVRVVEDAADVYEHVIVVEGNHEHYERVLPVDDNVKFIASCMKRLYPKVHYLDGQNAVRIGDILVAGGTGWYNWRCYENRGISHQKAYETWTQGSNDSRFPIWNDLSPEILAGRAADNLRKIVESAQDDETVRTILAVSHMSPHADLMQWRGGIQWDYFTPSYVNSWFNDALMADKNQKLQNWVYGHTHYRGQKQLGHTVFTNNARGYPHENNRWFLAQIEV